MALRLDNNDPILAFLAVHDTLLETRWKELETDMRRITGDYQERARRMAETIVGDVVQKLAAEDHAIRSGMRPLSQQQPTDTRRLIGTIKPAADVVSAALIIAAITMAFFNDV